MKILSFVIIAWNSEKTIENCLRSIERCCERWKINYEIFVVDNGSTDSTLEIIRRISQSIPVELIRLSKNLGTTITRNMALRKCTGEIICIMDSDAALLDGKLPDLADMLLYDRSIGILAPKLLFRDGAVQHSVRRFPSIIGKLSRIPAIVFKLQMPTHDAYRDFPFDCIADVDYAISACWFIRRDMLDLVGYLDERIFYSPEDVDYCIRTWKKGKRVVYYPRFTVLHHVQQITHKKFFSRIALSHLLGLLYYFMKHRYAAKPPIGISPPGDSCSGTG